MFNLSMEHLINCFNKAIETNANYIGVLVKLPNEKGNEVIINNRLNFEDKLKDYQNTYDQDLNHKEVPGNKIIAFTHGESFADIEWDLLF